MSPRRSTAEKVRKAAVGGSATVTVETESDAAHEAEGSRNEEGPEGSGVALGPDTVAPPPINLTALKRMDIQELARMARDFAVEDSSSLRRQELIFGILQVQTSRAGQISAEGVLEVLSDGFGFLRSPDYNYLPGPDDIYISPSQVRRFHLQTGDVVSGLVRPPRDNERYFALLQVTRSTTKTRATRARRFSLTT